MKASSTVVIVPQSLVSSPIVLFNEGGFVSMENRDEDAIFDEMEDSREDEPSANVY